MREKSQVGPGEMPNVSGFRSREGKSRKVYIWKGGECVFEDSGLAALSPS